MGAMCEGEALVYILLRCLLIIGLAGMLLEQGLVGCTSVQEKFHKGRC